MKKSGNRLIQKEKKLAAAHGQYQSGKPWLAYIGVLWLGYIGGFSLLYTLTTVPAYADHAAGEGKGETVNVTLKEWKIRLDKEKVKAGLVTFKVRNTGGEDHELVIIKTDRHPKDLPASAEGKVDEEAAGELIGEIEEFSPSQKRAATFALKPGAYALVCNMVEKEEDGIESHYRKGMRLAFTVE